MTKSIARLCASCNAINFSAYVWPPSLRHVLQTLPEIDIGTTQSVRDRRHVCKLCNLIATQLDQAQSLDIVQNAGDQCRLRSARFEEEELQDHHVEAGTMRDTLGFVARCIAVDIIPVAFTGFVGPLCLTGSSNPMQRIRPHEKRRRRRGLGSCCACKDAQIHSLP
jgi:hypothetical protein